MSISLLEQKNKYKSLLPVLGAIVLVTLIILWFGFFRNPSSAPLSPAITSSVQKINIDWDTLKNPLLETLEPFDVIPPLQGAYGRKNPFLPY